MKEEIFGQDAQDLQDKKSIETMPETRSGVSFSWLANNEADEAKTRLVVKMRERRVVFMGGDLAVLLETAVGTFRRD